jgi:hypothetical protein
MESDLWFRVTAIVVGTLPVALVIALLFWK